MSKSTEVLRDFGGGVEVAVPSAIDICDTDLSGPTQFFELPCGGA